MGELPDTNEAEARRWLGQASEELLAARRIAEDRELAARRRVSWPTWSRRRR